MEAPDGKILELNISIVGNPDSSAPTQNIGRSPFDRAAAAESRNIGERDGRTLQNYGWNFESKIRKNL